MFYKKAVLKNFAIFTGQKQLVISVLKKIHQHIKTMWLLLTGKHLCWSSLFNSEYCETFQSTYFEEHLQAAASENMFIKIIHKEI